MAFSQPPNTPPGPPQPKRMTLAQASAAGTATTAPTTSFGERLDSGGGDSAPPAGVAARPPVAPHQGVQSVGTHDSQNPQKRANPAHGWGS